MYKLFPLILIVLPFLVFWQLIAPNPADRLTLENHFAVRYSVIALIQLSALGIGAFRFFEKITQDPRASFFAGAASVLAAQSAGATFHAFRSLTPAVLTPYLLTSLILYKETRSAIHMLIVFILMAVAVFGVNSIALRFHFFASVFVFLFAIYIREEFSRAARVFVMFGSAAVLLHFVASMLPSPFGSEPAGEIFGDCLGFSLSPLSFFNPFIPAACGMVSISFGTPGIFFSLIAATRPFRNRSRYEQGIMACLAVTFLSAALYLMAGRGESYFQALTFLIIFFPALMASGYRDFSSSPLRYEKSALYFFVLMFAASLIPVGTVPRVNAVSPAGYLLFGRVDVIVWTAAVCFVGYSIVAGYIGKTFSERAFFVLLFLLLILELGTINRMSVGWKRHNPAYRAQVAPDVAIRKATDNSPIYHH